MNIYINKYISSILNKQMSKVYQLCILNTLKKNSDDNPIYLGQALNLEDIGFFYKSTAKEMLMFFTRLFVKTTVKGQKQTVQHDIYNVHIYCNLDGLAGVFISDIDYPLTKAYKFIEEMLKEYELKNPDWKSYIENYNSIQLKELLKKTKDPENVNKLCEIQTEIKETTNILRKSMDNIIERSEQLDKLVEKSNELSKSSKLFYKKSKEMNKCCSIS